MTEAGTVLAVKRGVAWLVMAAVAIAALVVNPAWAGGEAGAAITAPGAPRDGTFRGTVSAVGVFRQPAVPLRYLVVGRWAWLPDAWPRSLRGRLLRAGTGGNGTGANLGGTYPALPATASAAAQGS